MGWFWEVSGVIWTHLASSALLLKNESCTGLVLSLLHSSEILFVFCKVSLFHRSIRKERSIRKSLWNFWNFSSM